MLNISPCSKMANNYIRKYFDHVLFTFQLLRSGPCRFGLSLRVAVTRKREKVGGARTRSLLCESHALSHSAKNADQSALVITSSSIADWSREEEPTGRELKGVREVKAVGSYPTRGKTEREKKKLKQQRRQRKN